MNSQRQSPQARYLKSLGSGIGALEKTRQEDITPLGPMDIRGEAGL